MGVYTYPLAIGFGWGPVVSPRIAAGVSFLRGLFSLPKTMEGSSSPDLDKEIKAPVTVEELQSLYPHPTLQTQLLEDQSAVKRKALVDAKDSLFEFLSQLALHTEKLKASTEERRKTTERDKAEQERNIWTKRLALLKRIHGDLSLVEKEIKPTRKAIMAAAYPLLDPTKIASSPNDLTEERDSGGAQSPFAKSS
ncbi:hypothetical protein HAX54_024308 [Datura stramonium]|uniref:Uncharacterized protein n=1 Tax=Datura stramonium TaxID=4076 RepID=A0ABS8UXV4_DATST|nr:hypothetical protein [Datura stramonium]